MFSVGEDNDSMATPLHTPRAGTPTLFTAISSSETPPPEPLDEQIKPVVDTRTTSALPLPAPAVTAPPITPPASGHASPEQTASTPTITSNNNIPTGRRRRHRLTLDDLEIKETLGTGKFGRVHLARNKLDDQYYAVKTLVKHDVVQNRQTRHINNERAILRSVNHPFLVNLLDAFQDDTHLFFVMEYVPGGELFRILRKQKRFSEEATKFYAAEVILALEYLHQRDIAYRDLKPENILLDAEGHIKLVDFGFAKQVPDVTWTVCGTPDYIGKWLIDVISFKMFVWLVNPTAPEIIRSKGYSKAVDWWGLGVLIYEMLVGRPPFIDKNPVDLYEKILDCRVPWSDDVSPVAKDLLENLLTSDISRRYGNLKDGSRDIKDHPFFEGLDFNAILERKVEPPFKPDLKDESDTRCFDNYDEPIVPYGQPQAVDPYRSQFPAF